MIQEAYVSFEVAKLLKEKGFDESCVCKYIKTPHGIKTSMDTNSPTNSDLKLLYENCEFCSAPTHQMVMAWLRKKYGVFIQHSPCNSITACIYNIYYDRCKCYTTPYCFDEYDDATEDALKYALENLI